MKFNYKKFKNLLARHEFLGGGVKSVLIVDDNMSFLNYAKAVFERDNVMVEAIEDPFYAIRRFIEVQPDVIFLDVNMPKINGYSLYKILNHLNYFDAKIIFLSANENCRKDIEVDEILQRALFLSKPISPSTLLSAMDEALSEAG